MQRIFIALTTTLVLVGCASPLVALNDPSRSFIAPDLANLLKPRDIPYEIKEIEDVEVGYNLMFSTDDNMQGYRLTLVFRNKSKEPKAFAPAVTLEDGGMLQVPAYSYDAFIANGAVLAGTQVPAIPLEQQSSYYSTGTIRNTSTGNSYSYSGTSTSAPYGAAGGFASGFARGMAQGAAMRAINDREEGLLMMRWANAFWLKRSYTLQPGAGAVGVLFFPSSQIGNLPLKLKVEISAQTFEFTTVSTNSR